MLCKNPFRYAPSWHLFAVARITSWIFKYVSKNVTSQLLYKPHRRRRGAVEFSSTRFVVRALFLPRFCRYAEAFDKRPPGGVSSSSTYDHEFVFFLSKSRPGFLVLNDTRANCLLRLFVHGYRLKSVKCVRPRFVRAPLTDRSRRVSCYFPDKRTLLSYCGNSRPIFYEAQCRRIRNISRNVAAIAALYACTNIFYLFPVPTWNALWPRRLPL